MTEAGSPHQTESRLAAPSQPLTATAADADVAQAATSEGEIAANLGTQDAGHDHAMKQEFLWHTYAYLNDYARFADTKAAFAGTIASAMLGALYAAKAFEPMVQHPFVTWTLDTRLAAGGATSLFIAAALAIWTVRPRLRTTQAKGFIYWNNIAAHKRLDLLRTSFDSQSADTLNSHLLHSVFDLATKVNVPKYRAVSLCITFLAIGAASAAAALVLMAP